MEHLPEIRIIVYVGNGQRSDFAEVKLFDGRSIVSEWEFVSRLFDLLVSNDDRFYCSIFFLL